MGRGSGKTAACDHPLLRPSLTISTVLNIIYVFNSFPLCTPSRVRRPKTDTMVTFLYMLAYAEQEMGAATALSVIGFLILAVVAGAYMMISMRKEEAR